MGYLYPVTAMKSIPWQPGAKKMWSPTPSCRFQSMGYHGPPAPSPSISRDIAP